MWEALSEIVRYRELLQELVGRDMRVRYKQTLLGAAWALFLPVAMMVVFTQIFAARHEESDGSIPYPLFAYCGLLPWQFFAASLKGSVESLTRNRLLVTKIYMPREVFPLAQVLACGVDFAIASLVLVGLMAWYDVVPSATVVLVPFVLLLQVTLSFGLALLVSMGHLFYRDVKYVFDVLVLLWMFATPVVYDVPTAGRWSWLFMLNPMTPIIESYRALILRSELPDPYRLGFAAAVSLTAFWIGVRSFHASEHLFAEKI
ncbi:MAG: ABC transporter permease [Planctomycetota bacterium]